MRSLCRWFDDVVDRMVETISRLKLMLADVVRVGGKVLHAVLGLGSTEHREVGWASVMRKDLLSRATRVSRHLVHSAPQLERESMHRMASVG